MPEAQETHKIKMLSVRNPLLLLAFFLLLALLSFLSEKAYLRNRIPDVEFGTFQENLVEKEQAMQILLDRVATELGSSSLEEWIRLYGEQVENKLHGKGFTLLIYHRDTLVYWSDNNTPVPGAWSDTLYASPFLDMANAYQMGVYREDGPYRLVGLILIKHHFPYQNKFLENNFQKNFSLPPWLKLVHPDQAGPGDYPVKDMAGQTIFYLSGTGVPDEPEEPFSIPVFLYFLTFLSFLFFLGSWFRIVNDWRKYAAGLVFSLVLLIFFKQLLHHFSFPSLVFRMEMFSPHLYAGTGWWSSLGDLVILSIITYFTLYLVYRGIITFKPVLPRHPFLRLASGVGLYFAAGLWYIFAQYIIRSLIIHSSISFELHRLLDLSLYTFLGLMAAGLLFFGSFLLLDGFALVVRRKTQLLQVQLMAAAGLLLSFLVVWLVSGFFAPVPWIFLLLFNAFLIFFRKRRNKGLKYNILVLFVFLFTLLALYDIASITTEKEKNVRKVLAVNLAAEHDAVAEVLLEEMGGEIRADSSLRRMLSKPVFTPEEVDNIFEYLQVNYFSGFWDQYYFEITICNPESSLEVIDSDTIVSCYGFFKDIVNTYGEILPDSSFWFLNDQNGRISYFGLLRYPYASGRENTLFIRLDSRLTYSQLGYPELLLDGKFERSSSLDRYSYAKYINNSLVTQSGDFPYSLTLDVYHPPDQEFSFLYFDGYSHLIYRIDENRQIIISTPGLKWIDLLVDTSYLFVYFFLWLNIILLLIRIPAIFREVRLNFKMRIQLAMVGTLFLALILIGGGAVYYSIRQYSAKHDEIIREKVQSVYVELDHKLAFESRLSPAWSDVQYANLNELLIKFSNVFFTDINLYAPDGTLLATSRPEIFEKGLTGRRIDNKAYRELRWNRKAEFVHRENIGSMKFLSAYVPFTNTQNQLLAYLNLPYFTRQTALSREISLLVVAIVNISFLLLLLTISLAVFISNKITDPLRMIQRKFSRLKLGRSYEKIVYNGKDEIGELVGEYNRMVTELARSVEKLARSERETAWREMAKQVAHEIKNPLTPMKLSIQQIKRAYDDKASGWEDNFRRFTQTMIEQIENLSAIANAFSHFAQMPKTSFEPVDMVEKVRNIAGLFGNTENVDLTMDLHGIRSAMVLADKEQMIRVLTNLVKNGIQAIPEGRQGKIHIDLKTDRDRLVIAIRDNGKGIPDELGDRLFMPNFTTKSSGMGLGLAIARNIISNTGGNIHYETRLGEGTTFFVELPLYLENDSADTNISGS